MTAAFFWDRSGECKDPLRAIEALGSSRAKALLVGLLAGLGEHRSAKK